MSPFSSRFQAAENSKPCAGLLGELRAPLGVFGILGNHDDGADPRVVTRSLEAHGVTVLRNFNLRIETRGERLWIAGVDDVLTGNAKLGQALQGIPADGATVLLAHEPDFADSVAGQAVDLQLSGHSHGGQVRFPLLGAVYLPRMARKYPYGLNQITYRRTFKLRFPAPAFGGSRLRWLAAVLNPPDRNLRWNLFLHMPNAIPVDSNLLKLALDLMEPSHAGKADLISMSRAVFRLALGNHRVER